MGGKQSSSLSVHSHLNGSDRVVKEIRALMIDLGTGYFKAGYAGYPKPSVSICSTLGRPVQRSAKTGDNRKENYVGEEQRGQLALRMVNPLRRGVVVDWEGTEAVLDYIFSKKLRLHPEEHAVMVADPPLGPITNREKTAEMFFETFSTPALHIASQSVLSIYAYGRTTGLVVESGHGSSFLVPIYEGYIMPHITSTTDYGGADLTRYLTRLMNENGHKLTACDFQVVEDIKQKCCYTAADFEVEMRCEGKEGVVSYELPDGKLINIGKERIKCSEALFNPSLMGSKEMGLHTMAINAINKCDSTILEDMFKNILLCGGSTMFSGFPVRFQKEVRKLAQDMAPHVHAIPERKYSVWYGGSILACLKSFQQLWVRKKDYDERGPMVIYRKCF
ncbi:actin-like protein 7A [Callorhinchus milii]|uniref:actin-like protein 7A n=1 Tax=Callorhinchus milii TaxID=7868 RepID=UPI00045739DB|nr:actin-like protein 7A [Callorhinchus milii]|eukprot:gi/632976432/ref/XP_007904790.1/ PREDICTED: actin-like protein 7A [Callorhinchus milii]